MYFILGNLDLISNVIPTERPKERRGISSIN